VAYHLGEDADGVSKRRNLRWRGCDRRNEFFHGKHFVVAGRESRPDILTPLIVPAIHAERTDLGHKRPVLMFAARTALRPEAP
jgi:hypothetical protein